MEKSVVTLLLAFATVAIVNAHYNVNPCYGRPDGFARDIQSCAHYWRCENGQATPGVCQSGRLFDAVTEQCLYREQVKCYQCHQNEYRLASVPRACPQYTMCFLGISSLNICPSGLVFDGRTNIKNCNYEPYPGGCYRENDSGVDDPVVQRCPIVWDRPVYIHDRHSCSVYYVCTKTAEVPQRRQCDSNLHFNSYLGVCDFPQNSNCPIQERPPTQWPPTGAPTRPPRPPPTNRPPYQGVPAWECPFDGAVFIPDRYDCTTFHACLPGGGSSMQRCAHDLHYDYHSGDCMLPRDAKCYAHAHPSASANDVYEREPQDSSSSEEDIHCRDAEPSDDNIGEETN